uniref:Uncharacterized protein n=1 Tax=Siphoviridae sp. ctmpG14 TaxID=2825654 RepID=A0A8S5PCR7_9CAUD|nr:MAG TPA: hypothetical protein [Siphoviridae sp. ctmpG14]
MGKLEEIKGGIGGYSQPVLDFDSKYFLFIYKSAAEINIFILFTLNQIK